MDHSCVRHVKFPPPLEERWLQPPGLAPAYAGPVPRNQSTRLDRFGMDAGSDQSLGNKDMDLTTAVQVVQSNNDNLEPDESIAAAVRLTSGSQLKSDGGGHAVSPSDGNNLVGPLEPLYWDCTASEKARGRTVRPG